MISLVNISLAHSKLSQLIDNDYQLTKQILVVIHRVIHIKYGLSV
jgi:hypothetical protein